MHRTIKTTIKISLSIFIAILVITSCIVILTYTGVFGKIASYEELKAIQNEEATLIYSSGGRIIGKIFASNRTNIRFDEIPEYLIEALISTEDKRYFSHRGIDKISYLRVFVKSILTADRQSGGGSTISQQLIKNLYGRRNLGLLTLPVHKIKEAVGAYRIEKIYTKEEILLLYLNSVPFGENVFGIEAAAGRYFSKTTAGLNIQEAALLVGMLKANTLYNPRLHPENAVNRRNQVLGLMMSEGFLDEEQTDSLQQLPLTLRYSNEELDAPAGYFAYQVKNKAEEILSGIRDKENKSFDLMKDGLKIFTTLDDELQQTALESIKSHLGRMQKLLDAELAGRRVRKTWQDQMTKKDNPEWKKNRKVTGDIFDWSDTPPEIKQYRDSLWHYYRMLNASVMMMEPGSGKIRAWVGGNHYRYLPYDLVLSRRQIASAFKPILYTAGLMAGFTPCTYLENEEKDFEEYEGWRPQNFDKQSGSEIAMWYALAHSVNLPTVDLYFKTGVGLLNQTCHDLQLPESTDDYPSVSLGSMDISLFEIVRAYGAFAYNGMITEPVMIDSILDAKGNILYQGGPARNQVAIPKEIARQITAILQKAIDEGTGNSIRNRFGIRMDLAGKTGTSQDFTDAWFISYTPGLVIGTWVGAMSPQIHFMSVNGTGSALALPVAGMIWKKIENSPPLRKQYSANFEIPESVIDEMDCNPVRNRFINWFSRSRNEELTQKKNDDLKTELPKKEKSGISKFFDRIFRGKEK